MSNARAATASSMEGLLQGALFDLTRKGRASTAVRLYKEKAKEVMSARTHYLAFVAACDNRANDRVLDEIYARALSCPDFDEFELNFARDMAVRLAEHEGRFEEARSAIKEVIRSREHDEGQDLTQLLADKLAQYKILILEGRPRNVSSMLFELLTEETLSRQVRLDAEWWYFVSCLLEGVDAVAVDTARKSLASNLDKKPRRRQAWRWCLLPSFGPVLTRRIIKPYLGL